MSQPAQRLLRLIALLQARRAWSGAELAERMGVDRRSIRRDIERLRELGYPVQASPGVGGGYRLGSGAPVLPLLLDEDEATTLALALRAAASSVAGIDEAAHRLLAKLDPLLPLRMRQQPGEVHAATATLGDQQGPDAALLGQLARACRQASQLAFGYRSHAGELSQRVVEAQHLINYGRRWYLLAWDLQRADWRTLRVDRMGVVTTLQAPGFHRRTPEPPEAMVRRAVSQSPFLLRAVLLLDGEFEHLRDQVPPWNGVLEPDGPQRCRLTMGADTVDQLAGQMLALGLPAQLVATTPPDLRDRLHASTARQLAMLGQGAVS